MVTRTSGEKLQRSTTEAVSGMAELVQGVQRELYAASLTPYFGANPKAERIFAHQT